jgi:hypothetical protein
LNVSSECVSAQGTFHNYNLRLSATTLSVCLSCLHHDMIFCSPRSKKSLSLSEQLAQAREITSPKMMPSTPGKKRVRALTLLPITLCLLRALFALIPHTNLVCARLYSYRCLAPQVVPQVMSPSPVKRSKRASAVPPQDSKSPAKKLLSPRRTQKSTAPTVPTLKSPGRNAVRKLGVKETPPTALAANTGIATRHRRSLFKHSE